MEMIQIEVFPSNWYISGKKKIETNSTCRPLLMNPIIHNAANDSGMDTLYN